MMKSKSLILVLTVFASLLFASTGNCLAQFVEPENAPAKNEPAKKAPVANPAPQAAPNAAPQAAKNLQNANAAVLAQQFRNGNPAQTQAFGAQPNSNSQFDYGPDLVDLIQRTITPAVWDVNGGPASVHYFRPLHALVVAAPGQTHDQLQNVLPQMRK
jgi:hypothetical protein